MTKARAVRRTYLLDLDGEARTVAEAAVLSLLGDMMTLGGAA